MKVKKVLIYTFFLLAAAIMAIVIHAILPSPGATVNEASYDSFLAVKLGFPVVASLYFILLYLHVLIVVCIFGSKSCMSRTQIGVRYGLAFALIYLVGMEEIVISSSSFSGYGMGYILFQFFMGLGDAIPVFLVCILITRFFMESSERKKTQNEHRITNVSRKEKVVSVVVIATVFTAERMIGYLAGYVMSDISTYPIPVFIWTVLFGVTFGVAYILICPIYHEKGYSMRLCNSIILTLGVNWIWFNSFIGLIAKGLIGQMILRSVVDVGVIYIGMWLKGRWDIGVIDSDSERFKKI